MSDTTKNIAIAKVAAVTAESQIAINAGRDKGILKGDDVILYRRVQIVDPETGENLGVANYPRLRLKVGVSDDKFAIAVVTDRYSKNDDGGLKSDAGVMIRRLKMVTVDPLQESFDTVLISIGEECTVRRQEVSPKVVEKENEPPF